MRTKCVLLVLVWLVGCASAPTVDLSSPIALQNIGNRPSPRVADIRPQLTWTARNDSALGHTAQWFGDRDFSPSLSVALPDMLDRAFANRPTTSLRLQAANIGVYRWSDKTPRAAADPIIFLPGASIAASVIGNVIGNAIGQAVTDRLLSREVKSRDYWAVTLVVDVDEKTIVASNRRIKETSDSAQVVLSELIQFTVDDVAFKAGLQEKK